MISIFQSTPPARGATIFDSASGFETAISIHAPREGGDDHAVPYVLAELISIHAPREGGDFQRPCRHFFCGYFNPRPPRGGRPPLVPR